MVFLLLGTKIADVYFESIAEGMSPYYLSIINVYLCLVTSVRLEFFGIPHLIVFTVTNNTKIIQISL